MQFGNGKMNDNSLRVPKQRLLESPVLSMYDPDLLLKVDCDASKYGLGAVLSHKYPDGTDKLIGMLVKY